MRGIAPAQVPGAKISVCHGVGGMFAASGTIIMSNAALARFPVFPVEPGIFSICYPQPLFGPKNG
jgi:hypothetical protein